MRKINFLISIPVFAFLAMVFSGCASVPEIGAVKPIQGIPGIYHRVEKGQTLWRISKIYGLDLDELVSINRISDSSNIETGQLIFIPRRQKQQAEFSQGAVEDFVWPATGRVISGFQEAHHDMINKGIDIQVSRGADILASRSGKVIFYSPNFKGFGKTIIIDITADF
ncbi:MAG: LysM peptidoglycan-binding domain-containing protein [Candidatus Omnitrophota bacterium]|jgi:murein DD-endopeptidase MepM/ murein hydrolase activator NlpD